MNASAVPKQRGPRRVDDLVAEERQAEMRPAELRKLRDTARRRKSSCITSPSRGVSPPSKARGASSLQARARSPRTPSEV